MNPKYKSFEAELKAVTKEFENGWTAAEGDEEMGGAILDYILKRERLRHQVMNQPALWPNVDIDTVHKLYSWDTNDPDLQLIQNVLRRLSVGREFDAVTLLKAAVQSKLDSFSKQQSKIAKMPRSPSGLQARIEEIVARNRSITRTELVEKLEDEAGEGNLILEMDKDTIELNGGKIINVTAIKDRLFRAKKKLLKTKKSR